MRKEQALAELLAGLFTSPERLRRFLYFLPAGKSAVSNLPARGSMKGFASEAVDELRRRGLIDADFFERLKEERPDSVPLINQLQDWWTVDISEWGRPPRSDVEGSPGRADAPAVFVSYSRRDADFFEELQTQLKVLERKRALRMWHEGRIRAGEDWNRVINEQLEKADIILLLVSPDFLSSDFLWSVEFERTLERHHRGEAKVMPIILRPCPWEETPIGSLQALPPDGEPVAVSDDPDAVWVEIGRRVSEAARLWRDAA